MPLIRSKILLILSKFKILEFAGIRYSKEEYLKFLNLKFRYVLFRDELKYCLSLRRSISEFNHTFS